MRYPLCTLACVIALVCPAFGQYVPITSSLLEDSSGTPFTGTITFSPVDNKGNVLGFRMPGGGQAITTPISCNVVNGAITTKIGGGTCRLPDTSQTNPVNVGFAIQFIDPNTGEQVQGPGYGFYQPSSTLANGNLDQFIPNNTTLPLETLQGGNTNATPITSSAITTALGYPPASSVTVSDYAYPAIDTFGNSLVQGTGATTFMQPGIKGQQTCWPGNVDLVLTCYANGPTAFAYLLAADFGNGGHDYGRGGDTDLDVSLHVATWAHPTLENNPVRTGLEGTNDVSVYGTNTNQQDTVKKALLFEAAQGAIPDSLKQFASSATATGTWTADANYPGAMYSTTSGSSLTFTFTSSSPVAYLAYMKCDNTSNGTANLAVNGAAGALEPSVLAYGLGGSSIITASGSHCGFALARNTGVAGSNTATITTTNGGTVEVFWAAGAYTAPATAYAPPLWIEGGTPFGQADNYEPASGQYDAIDSAVVALLASDGNNVKFANVRAYMNSTTDYTGGGGNGPSGAPWAASFALPLHPGDAGHYHIYRAFHDQLPGKPLPSQTLSLWGGPFGYITGANSVGGRYGADTGDQTVSAATTLTLHNDTSTPLKDTPVGAASGSAGIDFEVADKSATNRKLTLRYFSKEQYNANQTQIFALEDAGLSNFPWLYNTANSAVCFEVATVYGGLCSGGSLNIYPNGQVEVNYGYTTLPGVIAGTDLSASGANFKVVSGSNAANARVIIGQESTAAGEPELVFYNLQGPANSRVAKTIMDPNGNIQYLRCKDDGVTCVDGHFTTPAGAEYFPLLKSSSGVNFLCADVNGMLNSQNTPCVTAHGTPTVVAASSSGAVFSTAPTWELDDTSFVLVLSPTAAVTSSATVAQVTFGNSFGHNPSCVWSNFSNNPGKGFWQSSVSATGINLATDSSTTLVAGSTYIINVHCK